MPNGPSDRRDDETTSTVARSRPETPGLDRHTAIQARDLAPGPQSVEQTAAFAFGLFPGPDGPGHSGRQLGRGLPYRGSSASPARR